jgi:hypothetical protein
MQSFIQLDRCSTVGSGDQNLEIRYCGEAAITSLKAGTVGAYVE